MNQSSKLEISIFLTIVAGMLLTQGTHPWESGIPLFIGMSLSFLVQHLFRSRLNSFFEGEFSKPFSSQKSLMAFGIVLNEDESNERERKFLEQIKDRDSLALLGSIVSVAAVFLIHLKMGLSLHVWSFAVNILTVFWFSRSVTLHHYCLCFMLNVCGVVTYLASGRPCLSFLPFIYLVMCLYSFYRYKLVNTEATLMFSRFSVQISWYRPLALIFPNALLILGAFWITHQIIPSKSNPLPQPPKRSEVRELSLSSSEELVRAVKKLEALSPKERSQLNMEQSQSLIRDSDLNEVIDRIKKGQSIPPEKLQKVIESIKNMKAQDIQPQGQQPSRSDLARLISNINNWEAVSKEERDKLAKNLTQILQVDSHSAKSDFDIEETLGKIKKGELVSAEKLRKVIDSAKLIEDKNIPALDEAQPLRKDTKQKIKAWITKDRFVAGLKMMFWIFSAWFLFNFWKKVETAPATGPDAAHFGESEKKDFRRLYRTLKKKRLPPQLEIQALYRLFLNMMAWTPYPRPDFYPTEEYTGELEKAFPELNSKLAFINRMFCKSIYSSIKISKEEIKRFQLEFESVFFFFLSNES